MPSQVHTQHCHALHRDPPQSTVHLSTALLWDEVRALEREIEQLRQREARMQALLAARAEASAEWCAALEHDSIGGMDLFDV